MIYQHTQPVRLYPFVFALAIVVQVVVASVLLNILDDSLRIPLLVVLGMAIAMDVLVIYLLSAITIEISETGISTMYRHGFARGFTPFLRIIPDTVRTIRTPFGAMVQFQITRTNSRHRLINLPSDEPEVLHEILLNILNRKMT